MDDGSTGTVVTGGVLTADAAGAITIDSTVTSADISTSAAGAVDLDETDGITLTDVDTNDGSIAVDPVERLQRRMWLQRVEVETV